jgi:hypothetical protein
MTFIRKSRNKTSRKEISDIFYEKYEIKRLVNKNMPGQANQLNDSGILENK